MSTVPPPPPQPPGPPFTSWGRLGLQPDSSLYIGRDDVLAVRSRGSIAASVIIRGRLQQPEDGRVVPQHLTMSSTSTRTATLSLFNLAEGYLLGLEILTPTSGVRRGSLYLEASLIRGGSTADDRVHKLCAGYLETGETLTWPGGDFEDPLESQGRIDVNPFADPAAGAEVLISVPTGARWRIHSVRFQLVTDITAVVRRVHLVVDNSAVTMYDLAAADTQAASLTRNYNCVPEGFQRAAQDNEIYIPIPADLRLRSTFRILTLTTNLQAGDNFGAPQVYTEEWLEET